MESRIAISKHTLQKNYDSFLNKFSKEDMLNIPS